MSEGQVRAGQGHLTPNLTHEVFRVPFQADWYLNQPQQASPADFPVSTRGSEGGSEGDSSCRPAADVPGT